MSETKRNDTELLRDILESIEKVERYTEGMAFEQFSGDEMTIDAVARNFGIIGEAAGRLNKEKIVDRFPEIEWRKVTGFRHKIVHDYFEIDVRIPPCLVLSPSTIRPGTNFEILTPLCAW